MKAIKLSELKEGQIVTYSNKNKNHIGNDVSAYAGFTGKIVNLTNEGFDIDMESTSLIIFMNKDLYLTIDNQEYLIEKTTESWHNKNIDEIYDFSFLKDILPIKLK